MRGLSGIPVSLMMIGCFAACAQVREQLPPVDMPAEQATDSYAIYSQLMPLGETAGAQWPHAQFLLQDATVSVVELNQPCAPTGKANPFEFLASMNPHLSIKVPDEYRQAMQEVLIDFDLHCHRRVKLDQSSFHAKAPVRLLDHQEQEEFRMSRAERDSPAAKKFSGAPGLYAFSEVYFSRDHSLALVYATHWCGGLCGEGFWVPVTREADGWKAHNWSTVGWIS